MKVTLLFILIAIVAVLPSACRRAVVGTPDVQVVQAKTVPADAANPVWDNAPVHISKLVLQDLVEPRLMEPSTAEVQVRAVTDGKTVAFRVEWIDATQDDVPGPKHFLDACAVQVPVKNEANVPAPQMGETMRPVQISYWRADWQAIVDGRADSVKSIQPNAAIDHYPYEAKPLADNPPAQNEAALRYAPARALGNQRSGPRATPVEDLIAEGPGTLSPAPAAFSSGKGVRTDKGWAVVITRPLPDGLTKERPSQVAFAVWEGAHGETGARKMRTGWVTLVMK